MIASRHLRRQVVICKSVPARLRTVSKLRCTAADRYAAQMASPTARGALVWLRNDLRVTDHAGLRAAAEEAQHLSAVYCLDGASLTPRRPQAEGGTGLPRVGPHRLKCVLHSVAPVVASVLDIIRKAYCRQGHMQQNRARMGQLMRRFVLEALQSLRGDLERLGSTLLFSTGPVRVLRQPAVLIRHALPVMHPAAAIAYACRGICSCDCGPRWPSGSGLRRH